MNRRRFTKLKPSKLVVTINSPLADLFIRQTFFHQMLQKSKFAKHSARQTFLLYSNLKINVYFYTFTLHPYLIMKVHYPSDPLQPGPMYFLTPRKCAIFGVSCESLPRQVCISVQSAVYVNTFMLQINYLIDEAVNVGKGANAIISMLHHFFSTFGLGETEVHLHADNCSGQNKNKYMMYYLMWRVLTKQHRDIIISFLPVGHTKFFPDAGFGMLKRQFRQTKVGCLTDIAEVVRKSASINHCQLVGNQRGDALVPSYDWADYFAEHTIKSALKGIKKMYHFRFCADSPGTVFVRSASNASENKIKLLKDMSWRPQSSDLPSVIIPDGLSLKRQWYLYDKIREFCPPDVQDLVCPMPRKHMPSSSDEDE